MKTITDYWRVKFVELQKQFSEERKKSNSEKQGLRDKIFEHSVVVKELQDKINELEKIVSSKEGIIGELETEVNSLVESHKAEIEMLKKENFENIRLVEEKRDVKETVLISEFVRFLKKDIGYIDGLTRVLDEICRKKDERVVVKSLVKHTQWMTNLAEELSWFAIPFIKEEGTVNPGMLVNEVLLGFNKLASEKNVKILKDIQSNIPEIPVSPDYLKLVFIEIIKNSFDAMPDGGTLTITAVVQRSTSNIQRESDFLEIGFSDTGRGIPEHLLRKIEKPFFSTKKRIGFGLGMTKVRKILDSYDGEMIVSSTEDRGTIVTLAFPVRTDAGDKKTDDNIGKKENIEEKSGNEPPLSAS